VATVVFDLDGTLVEGDAFGAFLTSSWRRAPWRLAVGALLWLVPGPRAAAELRMIGATTYGRRSLDDSFRAHAARVRIEPALARLEEHRAAGDRVVVATACAEPLARLVLADLGLADIELVASPYEHRRWGAPRAVALRGELKVDALRRKGIAIDHAYSDSLTDLPLLKAAGTPHLVRPRHGARLWSLLGDIEVLR